MNNYRHSTRFAQIKDKVIKKKKTRKEPKKRRNGRTFQEIKIQIDKVLCFVQSEKQVLSFYFF